MTTPLWQPSSEQISSAHVTHFIQSVNRKYTSTLKDFSELHAWSIENVDAFWREVWDFCEVIGEKRTDVYAPHPYPPKAKFFPQAKLNYAENLLRRQNGAEAIVFWGEESVKRTLLFKDLQARVTILARYLEKQGVKPKDRVAGYLPNMPETIIAMLACAAIGATWSSCSPDFGMEAVLDRFSQITPKVFISSDGYFYKGKWFSLRERVKELLKALPSVEVCLWASYGAPDKQEGEGVPLEEVWKEKSPTDFTFQQFSFDHPLFIMFSSGTTGKPKCIVHGAGGTLLQHLKEHRLHCDIKENDRVFYFTTCGWMMWNWQVSALASKATLLLYDGSPFYPDPEILLEYAEQEKMTLFGVSAKYIESLKQVGVKLDTENQLPSLRMITSTGSPLSPEAFEYVYESLKKDVCLSSISGGTDIISCFLLGNPIGPVWKGQLQAKGLGMDVQVWSEEGKSIEGEKGELVCCNPFPSMPTGFWQDVAGEKYHEAYFSRFENTWCHGDYVEITPQGGAVIYGRSDTVLNPGGVRIGTAEIYRQVERVAEVAESIAIGQPFENDVRVVLYVKLKDSLTLSPELIDKIKKTIRSHATPRHVPALILQVSEIPKTKNGKLMEKAVFQVVTEGVAPDSIEGVIWEEFLRVKNL